MIIHCDICEKEVKDYPHDVGVVEKIEKLDTRYYCICTGNAIIDIENKINEIITFLNKKI